MPIIQKNTSISYGISSNAWESYYLFLENLAALPTVKKICEVGGGCNPALSLDFITKYQLEYTILDISEKELAKAPSGYTKVTGDIACPNFSLPGESYDLIFSKMLAEHVFDAVSFHKNIFNLLAPGGKAFHFFPTLYSSPFVINKFLPESFSQKLLMLFDKHRDNKGRHGKFPAFYHMCKGPTERQIKLLEDFGYSVENYIGFFGHGYYEKIPILNSLNQFLSKLLLAYPTPLLTSYAYLVLSKPK